MTVRTITTSTLKALKNSVIGNPAAKLALAQDTALIHLYVTLHHARNRVHGHGLGLSTASSPLQHPMLIPKGLLTTFVLNPLM